MLSHKASTAATGREGLQLAHRQAHHPAARVCVHEHLHALRPLAEEAENVGITSLNQGILDGNSQELLEVITKPWYQ